MRKMKKLTPSFYGLVLFLALSLIPAAAHSQSYSMYGTPTSSDTSKSAAVEDQTPESQAAPKRRKKKTSVSKGAGSISKYKRKRKKRRRSKRRRKGNVVNLDALDSSADSKISRSSYDSGNVKPNFKIVFDLLMT